MMKMGIATKFAFGFVLVSIAAITFPDMLAVFPNLSKGSILTASVSMASFIGLIIGYIYSKIITRDFSALIKAAGAISEGDLNRKADVSNKIFEDETTQLANSINVMAFNLRDLAKHIKTTSSEVAEYSQKLSSTSQQINISSTEISGTMGQIAKGSEVQSELIEKSAKMIRDMAQFVQDAAGNSNAANQHAGIAREKASSGSKITRHAVNQLMGVFKKIEDSSKCVYEFGNKTKEIAKMVDVISSIANKTNLLALNATIEAARAGESGRGFAVVAEEIRKLAETTQKSAELITSLVEDIGGQSQQATASMQESMGSVSNSHEDLGRISESFEDIVKSVSQSTESIEAVAKQISHQTHDAQVMVKVFDDISAVTENTAAGTQEIATALGRQSASIQNLANAVVHLYETSTALNKIVDRFQI